MKRTLNNMKKVRLKKYYPQYNPTSTVGSDVNGDKASPNPPPFLRPELMTVVTARTKFSP